MSEYPDEVRVVYAYISDIMAKREITIYKVVYGDSLDLYYGKGGRIRVSIERSVAISRYAVDPEFDWDTWDLVASIDLSDPKCLEKVSAIIDRIT